MLYSGPAGPTQAVVEPLVADVGLRPVRVGDNDKVGLVDDLTRLWFTLAFEQGLGRDLGLQDPHPLRPAAGWPTGLRSRAAAVRPPGGALPPHRRPAAAPPRRRRRRRSRAGDGQR